MVPYICTWILAFQGNFSADAHGHGHNSFTIYCSSTTDAVLKVSAKHIQILKNASAPWNEV